MASLDGQLSRITTRLTQIRSELTQCKARNELKFLEVLREEQENLREEQEELRKVQQKEQEELRKEQQKELRKERKRRKEAEENLRHESALTRKEWLKQDLPELQVTFGAEPGLRDDNWDYEPQTVKIWNYFEEEVRENYDSIEDSEGVFRRTDYDLRLGGDNENVPTLFTSLVLSSIIPVYPIENCQLCPGPIVSRSKPPSGYSPQAVKAWRLANPSRFIPDFVIEKGGEKFLVVEVKRTSVFRRDSTERVVDLSKTYYVNPLHAECIRQLLKYLAKLNLLYGVLSSADISYFVRRVDSEEKSNFNCLEISKGITWNSRDPTILQAFYYIYHQAISDMESHREYDFGPARKSASVSPEETTDDSPKTSSGEEYKPIREDGKVEMDESAPSKRQKLRSHTLLDTPAGRLNLEDAPYASGGSSGNVVLGNLEGQKVAVKLAPVNSSIGKALLNEVEAYMKLRHCWGLCMPRLVDYGTTVHGQVIYIATEFIIGRSMGLARVTPAVVMAAMEGLSAIHKSGILHGDIHDDNILVVGSGVRFIDFGFARSCTGTIECMREHEQLDAIILKSTRRGHARLKFCG